MKNLMKQPRSQGLSSCLPLSGRKKSPWSGLLTCVSRGVARIFQRGGHTVSKQGLFNYGQDIVMAFSPPVVGCLVKKACKRGGHGHPRTPPGYALGE